MNSYNGFTPTQRMKALKWLREQQKLNLRTARPNKCDTCGQEHGILEWHSEDYSEPFGDHIGQYGLCYICHMMIHCRFKSKQAWSIYLQALKENKCFEAFQTRNWTQFRRDCLQNKFKDRKYTILQTNGYETMAKIGS